MAEFPSLLLGVLPNTLLPTLVINLVLVDSREELFARDAGYLSLRIESVNLRRAGDGSTLKPDYSLFWAKRIGLKFRSFASLYSYLCFILKNTGWL
jgi:hypothetical protein